MKKLFILNVVVVLVSIFLIKPSYILAQTETPTPTPPYEACGGSGCPTCPEGTPDTVCNNSAELICAPGYEAWLQDKTKNYWVVDPEVTALGRGGERSRQFLFWNLNSQSINDLSSLTTVWSYSRNITFSLLLIVVALFGLGIIIGRKYTGYKIEVFPLILKIMGLFLFAAFSSFIVLLLIQLSDTIMRFFTTQLGVEKLFNIFFTSGGTGGTLQQSESAYKTFQGCSNISVNDIESVKMSKFLVQTTNMTYYLIGIMLILRRVLLWFLLFVSPFLAILMPFVFIRNIGWIWIGVFFQWVFYGPLFALFLGGVASIWGSSTHIPYVFNFDRAHTAEGHIFPTAINILYGGPAQTLGFFNSSNYIDTFAEYVISLIMLWAAIFFPWWLLRIFRDYCCEGIYSMRNTLMAMYDQMRGGPSPQPPQSPPTPSFTSTGLNMPKEVEIPIKIKIETMEEIKRSKTEEITRSLNLSASHLTDIAHFETNRQTQETVRRNLDYLANPTKAETPRERQKYMNIRTELFSRAIKDDRAAKQVLSSISTSPLEKVQKREEITKTLPQMTPVTHVVSVKVQIPREKVSSVSNSFIHSVSQNNPLVQSYSTSSHIAPAQVQSVLQTFVQNMNQPVNQIVTNISQQTGVAKETVSQIIHMIERSVKSSQTITTLANSQQLTTEHVEKIIQAVPAALNQVQPSTIATVISGQVSLPQEKIAPIVQQIFQTTTADTITQISQETALKKEQVSSVLQTFVQNMNQPVNQIVTNISQQTGVAKETVVQTISSLVNQYKLVKETKETVKNISQLEQIKEHEVEKIITSQLPLVSEPEQHIEQTVAIPATVSLEDYENVKKMWIAQYEKGEIPFTENITSRKQWVEQDTVFITNTLNKLLSSNDILRQEGLDDLGYILPVFLINNLKGEELVVYLKAKLEAAKTVQEQLEKENELKEKIEEENKKETVDVKRPKKEEAEKAQILEAELKKDDSSVQ